MTAAAGHRPHLPDPQAVRGHDRLRERARLRRLRPRHERARELRALRRGARAGRLSAKANEQAGALTLLDRKRLELARALAGDPSGPAPDEIAGGLTETEVEVLIGPSGSCTARASRSSGSSTSSTRCWRSSTASSPSTSAASSSRATPTRSCAATRCRPATWGGRRYEPPRGRGGRRLLRRLPGAVQRVARPSKRARRSPVIGANGGGKSTLLRRIAGLLAPGLGPGALPRRARSTRCPPTSASAWASRSCPRAAASSPA